MKRSFSIFSGRDKEEEKEMSEIKRSLQTKPQTCTRILSCLVRPTVTATTAMVFVGIVANKALADPPVPNLFCFRITDIGKVAGDPEGDKFQIEFEVLNWTDMPATDLDIALDAGTDVVFDGAFVDANGRPLGPGDSPPPGNLNTPNDWSLSALHPPTSTFVRWDAGTPIDNIDILKGESTPFLIPGNLETVDNGPNVLDGFVVEVDDWNPGEKLSFNWFLTNNGVPIGTAAGGNAYGYGVTTLARIDGLGLSGPPFTIDGMLFDQRVSQFVPNVYQSADFEFAAQFEPQLTLPFQNTADSEIICGPGGCPLTPVPEPASTLLGSGLLLGIGGFLKRKSSRKEKNSLGKG